MKMYNKELKERYLSVKRNTTQDISYIEVKFQQTAEYEEKLGKDVSCFTGYEITDMYKMLNFKSFNTLSMFHSVLQQYTNWCIQQGVVADNQNHFLEFSRKQFDDIQNSIIKQKRLCTRKQVLSWCRELPNPCDAFLLLGMFEGICGKGYEELGKARFSDINIETRIIKLCSGREIEISKELIAIAEESSETFEYTALTANGRKIKLVSDPNDLIVKEAPQATQSNNYKTLRHRIYYRMLKSFSYVGVAEWMNPNAVITSGKINYIRKKSDELGITPIECIKRKDLYDELQKRFDFEMKVSSFIECYKGYLT